MIFRIFFPCFLIFSYTEPCVKTIPPEEVYITSTGANLPFTDEPDDVTTEDTETNAPVTDAPVTNTPIDQCTTCNIDNIAPDNLDTGEKFTPVENAAAGECKQTQVTCERTDDKICQSVGITATTPNGPIVITDTSSTTNAVSTLKCAADGTYSWATSATGITKLTCNFVDCQASACIACDATAIGPTLTAPETVEFTDTAGADGCKQTMMTCKRTDDQVCATVGIRATSTTPAGTFTVDSQNNADSAATSFTCAADGAYTAGTLSGITQLFCDFTNCMAPTSCTTCDAIPISPILIDPTNTIFELIDGTDPNTGCKTTMLSCQRTDNKVCGMVTIRATSTTPGETSTVVSQMNANSVSTVLECSAGGTFKAGKLEGITELFCDFEGCTACRTCALPTGSSSAQSVIYISEIGLPAPNCNAAAAECNRIDDRSCETVSLTQGANVFLSKSNTNYLDAIFTCNENGVYVSAGLELTGPLQCTWFNCQ